MQNNRRTLDIPTKKCRHTYETHEVYALSHTLENGKLTEIFYLYRNELRVRVCSKCKDEKIIKCVIEKQIIGNPVYPKYRECFDK